MAGPYRSIGRLKNNKLKQSMRRLKINGAVMYEAMDSHSRPEKGLFRGSGKTKTKKTRGPKSDPHVISR